LLADARADRHDGEADDVDLAGLLRTEEVGQAQVPVASLAREGEPAALSPVAVEDDQVVSLADARVVAVDDTRLEQPIGVDAVQQRPQPRSSLGLDELLIRRAILGATRPKSPLTEEE